MLSSAGDTDRPMHVLKAAIQTGYCALTLLDMIPCWARCDHDRIFNNCAYYLRRFPRSHRRLDPCALTLFQIKIFACSHPQMRFSHTSSLPSTD
jgi:hypothetical protein